MISAWSNHFNGDILVHSFSHLMFKGRVRLLNESRRNIERPLSLNSPMSPDDLSLALFFDALQKKHPEPGSISHHILLPATLSPDHDPHFISFEQLNDLIKCTALNLGCCNRPLRTL